MRERTVRDGFYVESEAIRARVRECVYPLRRRRHHQVAVEHGCARAADRQTLPE